MAELIGLFMPFQKKDGKLPAASTPEETIEASIKRILFTRKGERVMRPNVGSKIFDFLFESVNTVTKARLSSEARKAISRQEPRITVISTNVSAFTELEGYPDSPGYVVTVYYSYKGQVETLQIEVSSEIT